MVAGTRIDPLRAYNPDFTVVGPPWLAVAAFVALGLLHGMVVTALAGRYSRALPLFSRQPRVLAAYSPLLLFILLFPLVAAIPVIILAGLVAVVVSRSRRWWPPGVTVAWPRADGLRWLPLVSWRSPGFTSALLDILGLS